MSHMSSFIIILAVHVRLRLSPFAFSTAPRKYMQVPMSEESYFEDLETAISARQNLNLPSSLLDVFFLHGMAFHLSLPGRVKLYN